MKSFSSATNWVTNASLIIFLGLAWVANVNPALSVIILIFASLLALVNGILIFYIIPKFFPEDASDDRVNVVHDAESTALVQSHNWVGYLDNVRDAYQKEVNIVGRNFENQEENNVLSSADAVREPLFSFPNHDLVVDRLIKRYVESVERRKQDLRFGKVIVFYHHGNVGFRVSPLSNGLPENRKQFEKFH